MVFFKALGDELRSKVFSKLQDSSAEVEGERSGSLSLSGAAAKFVYDEKTETLTVEPSDDSRVSRWFSDTVVGKLVSKVTDDSSSEEEGDVAAGRSDVLDLDDRMLASIKDKGFFDAWEEHFEELVQKRAILSELGLSPGRSPLREVYDWAKADESIKKELDELSVEALAEIEEQFQEALDEKAFIAGVAGLRDSVVVTRHPTLKENGKGIPVLANGEVFQNWGRTVKNAPALTFAPTTVAGVCEIVKDAAAKNKRVRASGYRHTWADLYSEDGGYLVSMLPVHVATDLPTPKYDMNPDSDLQGVTLLDRYVEEGGVQKRLCRIGAGTTNEMFRQFLLGLKTRDEVADDKSKWKDWTIPLNVIMVEITFGGSNAPVCHGAGLHSRTLSDLVEEIEFVNANGVVQTVSDKDELRAAAGAFGLLGIVTAVTLRLDPMTYANMHPSRARVALTIPPPKGFDVPRKIDWNEKRDGDAAEAAWKEFVRACEKDYYSEWFWFAYHKDCWINTWDNTGSKHDAVDYPGPKRSLLQAMATYAAGITSSSKLFKLLPPYRQAQFMSASAMAALPSGETIVTPVIDALHFQRGIHNMRVLDTEFEIPIPGRADDPTKPDWSIAQDAWWQAITLVYDTQKEAPMRLALEMRITRDSDVLLAPQRGNVLGTASIEVLTIGSVDHTLWHGFMQKVASAWFEHSDSNGKQLLTRPHWAKQWEDLDIKWQGESMPIFNYLKRFAYKTQIEEFRAILGRIATKANLSLADLQARFSNETLDKMIFAE
mmetsp:Transcript_20181/g.77265  ORF Transcript_20181/g.77265 Transcript_20181/m.77265 type:complete len:771 (-) Transcript_20181:64-2376(-)